MGTSSIYYGKNDKNPLLPDDYVNDQNDNSKQNKPVKWEDVKMNMSKYINSDGRVGSVNHIARQYVRASGGSQNLASQSSSGVHTGKSLGTFLNNLRSEGFLKTFENLGIEFTGKSVQSVFSCLVDILAPASNTKEDVTAKEAAQQALCKIYDYVENNHMNLECLDRMPIEVMTEALCEYVSSYIWVLMMKDLESRFEMYVEDPKQSLSLEKEFKGYISSIVKVEFVNKGDIINKDVNASITELYNKCLVVLEGTV